MLKAEADWKLGLLHQILSQVWKAMERFLKEINNAMAMNTQMKGEWNSLITNLEKALGVWLEDLEAKPFPLSQTQIQSKALTLFNSMKAERGEEAVEEKSEANRGWFMRVKEGSCLHNIKAQVKQ